MYREEEWSALLLDSQNLFVRQLHEFTGGNLDYNSSSKIHGSGAIKVTFSGDGALAEDWGASRIGITYSPNVGVDLSPMGVFLVAIPTWTYDDDTDTSSASITLMDKLTLLDQDAFAGTHTGPTLADGGDTVLAQADQVVFDCTGEHITITTDSAKYLAISLVWAANVTKLQIVNDLLDAINYVHLWCDRDGKYRTDPYVDPMSRPVTYTFNQITPSYLPDWKRDNNWYDVPNKVVQIGQATATTEALIATATDTDPASPYSYANRGNRWITLSESGVVAADSDTLTAKAVRRLSAAQYRASNLGVSHVVTPEVWLDNRVAFTNGFTNSTALVGKWSVNLVPGSLVQATWLEVSRG